MSIKRYVPLRIKRVVLNNYKKSKVINKPKIFCIGLNKTGTTSIEKEMLEQGYMVGDQMEATKMIDHWAKRDFKPIINFCKTAQFFQDAPFSYPYTYIPLDQAFADSKFILTVRDDAEQWYNSLIRFHGKLWGNGNVPPTPEDLREAPGPWPGFRYYVRMMVHDIPENDPYNKDVLITYYHNHIRNVKDYFRHRPNDLLVINLKDKECYSKFCAFLGIDQKKDKFPWENRT